VGNEIMNMIIGTNYLLVETIPCSRNITMSEQKKFNDNNLSNTQLIFKYCEFKMSVNLHYVDVRGKNAFQR
jgi:hypothetical protein